MADGNVSEYVWVKPIKKDEFHIPWGCRVIKSDGRKLVVRDDDKKEIVITSDQIVKSMHITSIQGVEDMITLGDLQEYAILRNLHMRYNSGCIYTYTGTMLVAINPYEVLPIYTGGHINRYLGKKIGEMPPHIFAVGDGCYREMKENNVNQCIVISGESGAGKTESTKLILQYLAMVSGKHSWIEQQIQETNPILEAFGNAKTVRNDNSSRFGKYIYINFNENGAIEGAKVEQYLLEKSRIVFQNQGERNYHIFYCLLAGLSSEEKKRLELTEAMNYEYLKGGKVIVCEGRDDAAQFRDVRAAMKVLNFKDEDTWSIFQLLAAILHLGNMKYKSTTTNNLEGCEISDSANAARVANILGVNKSSLCDVLTKKTIKVQGEQLVTTLSKQNAFQTRDSFVKAIYGKIFIMIVEKINNTISKPNVKCKNSIGVLDIFGFENFNVNSFEQLCINYANENLQQFFVKHIFKMEQEEYSKEGIDWVNISFVDNDEVLQMIGVQKLNIMSLIDEETKFPKGTDVTMLTKLHSMHSSKEIYIKPKSDHKYIFGVKHFAGDVNYEVDGFLDKNKDTFSADIQQLLRQSNNAYLKELFKEQVDDNKRDVTLSLQFRTSLDVLMKSLYSCHPFFIRCIKPNELKKPKLFDHGLCVRQLRYAGMMETARIRRAGYPIRHKYFDFVNRYRILGYNVPPAHKGNCKLSAEKICKSVFSENEDYQLGHTKLFLKDYHDNILEETRKKKLEKYILILQKNIRRWIWRRRYIQLHQATIVVQKYWRARGYRQRYLTIKQGYLRMQAAIRSRVLKAQFSRKRRVMVKLQSLTKGYLIRKMVREKGSYIRNQLVLFQKKKLNEIEEMKSSKTLGYMKKAEDNYEKRYKHLISNIWNEYPIDDNASVKKHVPDDDRYVDGVFEFLEDSEMSKENVEIENEVVTETMPRRPKTKEESEDLSEYDFKKFAATYFASNNSYQYSRKALKRPLLEFENDVALMWSASRAIWMTILRFMGDISEPRDEGELESLPIMIRLLEIIGKYTDNFQDDSNKNQNYSKLTLKRKTKFLEQLKYGLLVDDKTNDFYNKWVNMRRTTNLEKLHFIIGHGILRPELRDEIYCQLCKQLSSNPSNASHARGWVLMSLIVGCFAPSQRFVNYLRAFIRQGPPGYAPYCESRLYRTMKNGARTQPPNWKELQAVKSKSKIAFTITLTDNSSVNFESDSASISEEIIDKIKSDLEITDIFGFSIFINLYDKVLSLGSGGDHLMDAVSQCEQFAREQGVSEKSAPWKLLFRKEIFSPWYNPSEDSISTNLVYQQIVKGIKFGEYRCKTENDIAMIAAQQLYIDYGTKIDNQVLLKVVNNYIPNQFLQTGESALSKWDSLVRSAFNSSRNIKEGVNPLHCKEDIVIFAMLNWPLLFSRFFEAIRIKGESILKDNVIIAVNWTGVFIIDDQEQVLLELSFVEINFVGYSKEKMSKFSNITFRTIQKEEFVFESLDAEELSDLVIYLIEGLKKRSLYVIGQNDYKEYGDSSSFLTFKQGDLITLTNDCTGETVMSGMWGNGECNGNQGLFPTNQVHILPTMNKPPEDIIQIFKKSGAMDSQRRKSIHATLQRQKMHTLQKYAQEHFRSGQYLPGQDSISKTSSISSIKKSSTEELWRHSRIPIKMPLLQKLQGNDVLCKEACSIYMNILKYMGDIPAPRPIYASEYTDEIFIPAIKHEVLRDEVYCQILKQLTNNKIQLSEERGWELMWLLTGSLCCSQNLLKEVNEFLKTRVHSIAKECAQRLFRLQKCGQRKCPPYVVEVEAIQHRSLQIYHKVYFPDDTNEAFEVDSTTKAKDLCMQICDRFELKNGDGFSLFVKIADKVFSVPESYYFFDYIYELIDYMKQTRPSRNAASQIQCQYQIFFMKKLWINTTPGKDSNADQIFYFNQELPKYLRGYHRFGKVEVVKLAALIYRSHFGDDQQNSTHSDLNLQTLLPNDMIRLQSSSEWRKKIISDYSKDVGKTPEDAKEEFLKMLFNLPTFGMAFFEVKQTTDFTYPEYVIVGISKNGVSIIHPQSKDVLITHPFSDLYNWSSGNTFFHMTIGNVMHGSKLLCETSLGYKMDDLITSYIDYLQENTNKNYYVFKF